MTIENGDISKKTGVAQFLKGQKETPGEICPLFSN